MIVRCSKCSSAFAVDDAKVENKKFAFSCPKCAHENIIDNTSARISVAAETGETAFSGDGLTDGGNLSAGNITRQNEPGGGKDTGFMDEEEFEVGESAEEDEEFNITLSDDIDISLDEEEIGGDVIVDTPGDADDDEVLDVSLDYLEGGSDELSETESTLPVSDEDTDLDDFQPMEEPILDEEFSPEIDSINETPEVSDTLTGDFDEDSITVDVDSLDITLDEDIDEISGTDREPESVDIGDVTASGSLTGEDEDESITLDIDSLDIDLDESDEIAAGDVPDDHVIPGLSEEEGVFPTVSEATGGIPADDDESVTLDLEGLDLDLVEEDEIKTGEEPGDMDLEMDFEDIPLISEPGSESDSGGEDISLNLEEEDIGEDESITLDLESLDLDLAEEETISEGEIPDDLDLASGGGDDQLETGRFVMEEPEEDESITIDLETLDIPLAETEEEMKGEMAEEDESITLEDAGLTFDELTTDELASATGGVSDKAEEDISEDEDIRLTIDEIDPEFDIDSIESDVEEEVVSGIGDAEGFIPVGEDLSVIEGEEDIDLLEMDMEEEQAEKMEETVLPHPEVDFGLDDEELAGIDSEFEDIKMSLEESDMEIDYPQVKTTGEGVDLDLMHDDEIPGIDLEDLDKARGSKTGTGAAIARVSDDVIDLEDEKEYDSGGKAKGSYFPVSMGNVNFSIDYSLAYTRLGAFLRLTGLFLIGLIPHFFVFVIYLVLSLILGMLNHIVVMTTSSPVEDFQAILEKTLRYYLSLNASFLGIVEELPVFTGTDDIDYPLQLNITYSLRNSSLLAALRLSVAGILIILLPHLIVLSLLTVALPAIFLIGIISVLATRRWPHFLFDFMNVYYNSVAKVLAYMMGLVDRYPPFKFG